jgi:hypothetical protein
MCDFSAACYGGSVASQRFAANELAITSTKGSEDSALRVLAGRTLETHAQGGVVPFSRAYPLTRQSLGGLADRRAKKGPLPSAKVPTGPCQLTDSLDYYI